MTAYKLIPNWHKLVTIHEWLPVSEYWKTV